MIEGIVTDALEPIVGLTLIGEDGYQKEIKTIIDTGFSGYLCLSEEYLADISVEYAFTDEFELANGRTISEDVFLGQVIFGGKLTEVFVILTSSKDSLLGASLLADFIVTVDYPRRIVTIK